MIMTRILVVIPSYDFSNVALLNGVIPEFGMNVDDPEDLIKAIPWMVEYYMGLDITGEPHTITNIGLVIPDTYLIVISSGTISLTTNQFVTWHPVDKLENEASEIVGKCVLARLMANLDIHKTRVCGIIIKNSEGKYLIEKHVKYHMLTMPSGKVDGYEEPIDAIIRETMEECGIVLQKEYIEELCVSLSYYDKLGITQEYIYQYTIPYDGEVINVEQYAHDWIKWMTREELANHHLRDSVILTKAFKILDK